MKKYMLAEIDHLIISYPIFLICRTSNSVRVDIVRKCNEKNSHAQEQPTNVILNELNRNI